MRIFVHNFVADKAKIRRRAAARQGFLTQYAAKFAEKTCAYAYEDRFLLSFYPIGGLFSRHINSGYPLKTAKGLKTFTNVRTDAGKGDIKSALQMKKNKISLCDVV